MNIALIGYGKMGKEIEKIAKSRGHYIILSISTTPKIQDLKSVDVAIEFSQPKSAFENIKLCLENNIPTVCGTTGWLKKYNIIKKICESKNSSFIYSSNFSISANIFFEINKKLADYMSSYSNYEISIKEIHHVQKLDIPSGTSISLAEDIIQKTNKTSWILSDKKYKEQISIQAKRIKDTTGIHSVIYKSSIDNIQIKHKAYNREGFALGAIIAAEWIKNKKGIFSMKEILGLH